MSTSGTQAERLAAIAALGEPLRRGIYLFVAAETEPVSRDRAAEHFGVSRGVAAFHLDKLADLGLLEVEFRRPPGRGGPGAGRPSKLYRAGEREVSFSLPPREYELAGRLLAEAVTASQRDGIPVDQALTDSAVTLGQSLGRLAKEEAGASVEPDVLVESACQVLSDCAYEPSYDGTEIGLANCPFHVLAEQYRDLVCGMNLAIMNGLAEELADSGLEARLDPQPGMCCVRLTSQRG